MSKLDIEPFLSKRLLSEMLHICIQTNSLNLQSDVNCHDSYISIINNLLTMF